MYNFLGDTIGEIFVLKFDDDIFILKIIDCCLMEVWLK
jgi:hypothetical protein